MIVFPDCTEQGDNSSSAIMTYGEMIKQLLLLCGQQSLPACEQLYKCRKNVWRCQEIGANFRYDHCTIVIAHFRSSLPSVPQMLTPFTKQFSSQNKNKSRTHMP